MQSAGISAHRAAQIVGVMLIATVVLQILYMATLGGPASFAQDDVGAYFTDRWLEVAIVWTVEAVAFAGIAIGALVALSCGAGGNIAWAAIALSGTFNLVQIGIGLSLFRPMALADGALFALFGTVVGAAFFFYFLAKALLGLAGLILGVALLRSNAALPGKIVAGIAALSGIAALVANIAGMALGTSWIFLAGASGTLAALFVAFAGSMAAKSNHGRPGRP